MNEISARKLGVLSYHQILLICYITDITNKHEQSFQTTSVAKMN